MRISVQNVFSHISVKRLLTVACVAVFSVASVAINTGCQNVVSAHQDGPIALSSKKLVLATYNVENLFDSFDNPYTADESTRPKPAEERAALAAMIKSLNADILIMQEIEAGGALKGFNENELRDAGFTYLVDAPTDDPRGISVGALTRLPVTKIVSHRYAPLDNPHPSAATQPAQQRFSRDLFRIDIPLNGKDTLVVYGLHLKSKRDAVGDPKGAAWRLAEARKAAAIVREQMAREGFKYVAIVGDFNDTPDAPPIAALRTATTPPMLDTLEKTTPRITFRNPRFQESIDYILLSPAAAKLWDGQPAVIVENDLAAKASDHRPVKITLRVPAE